MIYFTVVLEFSIETELLIFIDDLTKWDFIYPTEYDESL